MRIVEVRDNIRVVVDGNEVATIMQNPIDQPYRVLMYAECFLDEDDLRDLADKLEQLNGGKE
jgi:hypothetical protein